jgi:hypothetical protein
MNVTTVKVKHLTLAINKAQKLANVTGERFIISYDCTPDNFGAYEIIWCGFYDSKYAPLFKGKMVDYNIGGALVAFKQGLYHYLLVKPKLA